MKNITVTICLGTTCHLMGSSHLQSLDTSLPERIREQVQIQWSRCLGYCKEKNHGKAPFVLIGDEMLCEATLFGIIERLEALLKRQ